LAGTFSRLRACGVQQGPGHCSQPPLAAEISRPIGAPRTSRLRVLILIRTPPEAQKVGAVYQFFGRDYQADS